MLLRKDGSAVACGRNDCGQCDIPALDKGISYIQVSAGWLYTVLLRSDGRAITCGCNSSGQCNIPSLLSWRELLTLAKASRCYLRDFTPLARGKVDYVLQLSLAFKDDAASLTCWDLAGHEVLRLRAKGSALAVETHQRIAHDLQVSLSSLRVVLPDGQLLAAICRANPLATIAEIPAG